MRGTKRRRDIFTLAESIDNWFEASGSAEDSPETGEGEILQDHATTFGEGFKPSRTSQVVPIGYPVKEGTNRWLGLRSTTPAQSNGLGEGSNRLLPSHTSPGGCHVARQPIGERERGQVLVAAGSVGLGGTGSAPSSLAQEASTWLGAHRTVTVRPDRNSQGGSTETKGPETPTTGTIIDEGNLTPEDFWSLLRDAGYKVW